MAFAFQELVLELGAGQEGYQQVSATCCSCCNSNCPKGTQCNDQSHDEGKPKPYAADLAALRQQLRVDLAAMR